MMFGEIKLFHFGVDGNTTESIDSQLRELKKKPMFFRILDVYERKRWGAVAHYTAVYEVKEKEI